MLFSVIPAHAGIYLCDNATDPGLRRDDVYVYVVFPAKAGIFVYHEFQRSLRGYTAFEMTKEYLCPSVFIRGYLLNDDGLASILTKVRIHSKKK